MHYVIRMTYLALVSHPDELRQIHYVIRMTYSSVLCHPDDLPGVGISSGWVTANSLCHPDDILFRFMSSGWLNWGWFLIRMSYGNVIMSSGWDTLPFLSHPDEIANFDFPHHAVALQRFRTFVPDLEAKSVFPEVVTREKKRALLMAPVCSQKRVPVAGILLGMGSANKRKSYIVTPPLIGWAHTQNDLGSWHHSETSQPIINIPVVWFIVKSMYIVCVTRPQCVK